MDPLLGIFQLFSTGQPTVGSTQQPTRAEQPTDGNEDSYRSCISNEMNMNAMSVCPAYLTYDNTKKVWTMILSNNDGYKNDKVDIYSFSFKNPHIKLFSHTR